MQGQLAIPKDRLAGLRENWKYDSVSGFILFLIALPLSLGIAIASGAPPLAGIFAAIIGGIVVSQLSGSYVTINGPAAGLIVVILGAVDRLGGGDVGYHCALAAIVISGILLLILGLLKAGELGQLFPPAVVHGMLASIGFIIILKQIPILLGVKAPAKEPLMLLAKIPEMIGHLNPQIAFIGALSMLIMIVYGFIKSQIIKKIPAPIIVVAVAVGLGFYFDLDHAHNYLMFQQSFSIAPNKVLVVLPNNPMDGIAHPDFSKAASWAFWLSVISITLVQGVETLLSAAAVDRLDKFKRQSDLSRDVAAAGLGTAISGAIGGLPMIAEIVRSSANVDNGARTRWSNFFHGAFMLVFVLIGTAFIDHIPLAALAGLLIYTGYRLSSPRVFKDTFKIGPEQLVIFCVVIITVLATDLLVGVITGVIVKLLFHIFRGAPLAHLFKAQMSVGQESEGKYIAEIHGAAIFSNYISIRSELNKIPPGKDITLNLTNTDLIDHTVMERLHQYERDYAKTGGRLVLVGLDQHVTSSVHPLSARRLKIKSPTGGSKH